MITMISSTSLEHFQRQRRRLISLSERLLAVLETLNMPALSEEVRSQIQRLHTDTLKVLVVGEFNTGKSTVLNALLGQKILPAYPVPTTALLTEVKWGEQPRALLHYRPSRHGSQKMPLEVPVPELETYLVINDSEEDLYERIELFWPLPLCRSGIELLDSPGLDDDDVYLEETLRRVPYVDAILFVLGCNTLPTREESLLIDRMLCAGHDKIFFLCNRFDLVEPSCREMVKRRRIAQLGPLTTYGDRYIFFTNAKGTLTQRIDGSLGQFEQARIQDMEEALYTFLQERGQDRLLDFSYELKAEIRKVLPILSVWRQLLSTDQETISAHYGKTQSRIDQIDRQYQQLLQEFTAVRSRICHETNVAAIRFYFHIEDRIPDWTRSYTAQEPCYTWDVFAGDPQTRLVKELTTHLTNQVQYEFQAWVSSVLQPLLDGGLRAIARDRSSKIEQLLWRGAENAKDIGEDVETILQDAVTRIATAVVRYERFVWHPLVLITRLLEMAGIQEGMKGSAGKEKMRNAVAWVYRCELMATLQQRANAIVGIVDGEICKIQEKLHSALCGELQCIGDRGQTNIAKEQPEHARANREVPLLIALEDELRQIEYELIHLISTKE